jgi:hypothetical protein
MTETQRLIARIHALARKLKLAPSTIGERVLGGGQILANLEAGRTITLAKYERANALLTEIESTPNIEQGRAA